MLLSKLLRFMPSSLTMPVKSTQKPNQSKRSPPQKSITNWRPIYFLSSTLFRFLICLQTSYIHPDEFFQSFQPIFHDNVPWEFADPQNACRSFVPLYLAYYPLIIIGRYLGFSSYTIYLLVKLEFCLLTWCIGEWCLYRILPIKQERIKTSFFFNTSYITLVYQSHTFSNSLETCLLLPVIYIINDIRRYMETKRNTSYSAFKLVALGFLVSLGIFNRITFLCWLILPAIYLIRFPFSHKLRSMIPVLSFLIFCALFVALDTFHFRGDFEHGWVLAPLNNILYNSTYTNLAKHGIHPRYTHLLINYPQILGPLLLLLFPFSPFAYTKTTCFLSYISGLLSLSVVPHQELRFLIPMVPLACACVNLRGPHRFVSWVVRLWVIFNVVMSLFMGCFHQAGVVPAINFLSQELDQRQTTAPSGLMFWRTYKPPTWMLPDNQNRLYFNRDTDNLPSLDYSSFEQNFVVDFMGMDPSNFTQTISRIVTTNPNARDLYLVAPLNGMLNLEESSEVEFNYIELWSTYWNYDMDHFEPDKFGLKTFTPGLAVYKLSL